MKKTLYILRHAKTEALHSGREDHERQLTARGVENAECMGKYLTSQHIMPDAALCSTATRAIETLAALQLPDDRRQMSDKLYLASANELLGLIAATPESIYSLMIIGHNPGLHELCLKLAKDGPATFPTCALATITFDGAWSDIGKAKATLAEFVTPKML